MATTKVTVGVIGAGAVDAAAIATGAVDTAEIATDAVEAAEIAAGAVGTSELAAAVISSVAKGWANFSPIVEMGTATLNDSFNVDSVSDDGTGDFTVTWATNFSSVNYATVVTCEAAAGGARPELANPAAGTIDINTTNHAGAASDPTSVNVVAFGDQ